MERNRHHVKPAVVCSRLHNIRGVRSRAAPSLRRHHVHTLRALQCSLCIVLAGWTQATSAMAGRPQDLVCPAQPTAINGTLDFYRCTFAAGSRYTPPTASWDYYVGFVVPHIFPQNHSLKIIMHWDGYGNASGCPTVNFGQPGAVVVKNCPDYYPTETAHRINNVNPLGWGGPYFGYSNAWRFTTALDKISRHWQRSIDWNAGITLEGKSYGGATALHQSLMFEDVNPFWQAAVTKVRAVAAPTLFVKPDTDPDPNVSNAGNYWRSLAIQTAWIGYDLDLADMIKQASRLKHIYFNVTGSPQDTTAFFFLSFYTDFCDAKKIACFIVHHNLGHVDPPLTIHLPFNDMFAGPYQDARLDQLIQVFTRATSNLYGPIGGYNLGLSWDSRFLMDEPDRIVTPLRYLALTNIYPGIADQPPQSTFDFTLRDRSSSRFRFRAGEQVAWVIGNQSGYVTVTEEGEVTIQGITLSSSSAYSNLSVTRTTAGAVEANR
jgi:hypothetical protein